MPEKSPRDPAFLGKGVRFVRHVSAMHLR